MREKKSDQCKGRLNTYLNENNDHDVKKSSEHTHNSFPTREKVIKSINNINEKASVYTRLMLHLAVFLFGLLFVGRDPSPKTHYNA